MSEHLFVKDMESTADEFKYTVDARDLLIDLKVLIKEYYAATFTEDGRALIMRFNNGQVFRLDLTEQI